MSCDTTFFGLILNEGKMEPEPFVYVIKVVWVLIGCCVEFRDLDMGGLSN